MLYQLQTHGFSQNLPLQLWMFGIHHQQKPIRRPQGVSYYQWFYCTKGTGEVILDQERSVVRKGQGFFIAPDMAHMYQGLSSDFTVHILAFHGSVCEQILRALQMDRSGVYRFSDSKIFETHMQKILWLYENRDASSCDVYSKECYDFLIDLSRCIFRTHELSMVREDPFILKIVSYLEANYAAAISLDLLADYMNFSKDYMCARFKSATGQTIIHCLTEIRIGHARACLAQYPEKRIIDIGHMCGFDSPSYFGKIFKKLVGMTPEQYRKNI